MHLKVYVDRERCIKTRFTLRDFAMPAAGCKYGAHDVLGIEICVRRQILADAVIVACESSHLVTFKSLLDIFL